MKKLNKVKVVTAVVIAGSKYTRAKSAARAWADLLVQERMRQRKQSLSPADFWAWYNAQVNASRTTTIGTIEMVDEWAMATKAYRRALPIFQRVLP